MVMALEFEKNVHDLESKLEELRHLSSDGEINVSKEIRRLEKKVEKMLQKTYANLTPWQKVQVARHLERPNFLDYINEMIEDFVPLAGDRNYAEDRAIIGGLGTFRGQSVVIMGHQKGKETEERIRHNFGMARPEGYRKAKRLMQMADKFNLPLITLVDTAGAHPGIGAEERGQSEAIASCIEVGGTISVPVVTVITGEGGSGGAIAIAVANAVHMLEHSVYSTISPEGCASILWRTRDKKEQAAEALKLTASDLKKLHVIDNIIPEPLGGAHRNVKKTIEAVADAIEDSLHKLMSKSRQELKLHRQNKFLAIGV